MKRILVPVADGTEEMEAVVVVDLLRRAGCEVCVAGIQPGPITGARNVRIVPDAFWDSIDPMAFDALVVPGGAEGTRRLASHPGVLRAARDLHAAGRRVAAICAAPLVLQAAGILDGRRATCHPGVIGQLTAASRTDDAVVRDGTITTSQGAGTATVFAISLIADLCDEVTATRVAHDIVYRE